MLTKNYRTVGIIGGFGMAATAKFYLDLGMDFYKKHQNLPPVVIWSLPYDFQQESDIRDHPQTLIEN